MKCRSLHHTLERKFYELHVQFLEALTTQNDDLGAEYLRASEAFLEETDGLASDFRHTDAYAAEVLFERSLIKFLVESNFSAANDARQALKLLRKQRKTDESFRLTDRLEGIVQVAVSTLPRKYQWLGRLLGITPDLEQGLAFLRKASAEGVPLAWETHLLLYYVERNLLNTPEAAQKRIESLIAAHPDRLIFNFLRASNYVDNGNTDLALQTLQAYQAKPLGYIRENFPYWLHLNARCRLYNGNFNDAALLFGAFLNAHEGYLLREDAVFRMAMALALAGNAEQAKKHLNQLLQMRASKIGEDAYARREAVHYLKYGFRAAEMALLQARYLYDGGYYKRAQLLLDSLSKDKGNLNYDHKTELYYRLGRVAQAKRQPQTAIGYYNLALTQPTQRHVWMQAYATYYIGQVEENNADWHRARYYYERTLSYDGYPYQQALEQKAKAGLERLKNRTYDVGGGK